MSHTITGKLNKPASQFQAGESTGFGVKIGVQYYNRETQQKEWTNYSAVIFAKQQKQIAFYQSALVEGAVIEISGQQIKIDQYQGQNGLSLTLELIDAKLGYVFNPNQQQPAQQPPQQSYQEPQRQGFAPQQQQANQQQQAPQQGFAPQQQQNTQPQQSYQEPQPQQQQAQQQY